MTTRPDIETKNLMKEAKLSTADVIDGLSLQEGALAGLEDIETWNPRIRRMVHRFCIETINLNRKQGEQ